MKNQTITLVLEDPKIKPALMERLVEGTLPLRQVFYIDYDLQFSSLLQNTEESRFLQKLNKNLEVMQPSDDVLDFVGQIASAKLLAGGVLILDSLNSVQNLLTDDHSESESKVANQKCSLVISVLQRISRNYSKSLLIIDVAKARQKLAKDQSTFWAKSLVGGRMIRFKSDVILVARENPDEPDGIEIRNTLHESDWDGPFALKP